MALKFDVRDEKKIRVIIDTDAACEADDPFAIAHALMSPKLMVKGITAAHFAEQGSVEKSLEEIKVVLKAMNKDVPAYLGEAGPMDKGRNYPKLCILSLMKQKGKITILCTYFARVLLRMLLLPCGPAPI